MARAFTPLVNRIGRLVARADRLAAWARAGLSERLEQAERETQAAVAREAVRRRGGQIDHLSHRVLRSSAPIPHNDESQPQAPQRSTGEDEGPPGNELAALLWVIVALLTLLEAVWWISSRPFSP